MLHVSIPEALFSGQKIFSVSKYFEKEQNHVLPEAQVKLILVFAHESTDLPPAVSSMLEKLILACKFTVNQALFVNSHFNKFTLHRLSASYPPELILIFGQINIGNNLSKLKTNHPYALNGVNILQTESLLKLEGNKKEKDLLWSALKKMLVLS